jgi:xanthine dehydrogenase accessory factor
VIAPAELLARAARLAAAGEPFVLATVVGVVRPASARRGDRAIVTGDGELEGWVGGACSEPDVVREALGALADGEPRMVRVEGSCASHGELEIFIEPCLPAPLLSVIGESPAAVTLERLAGEIGWRTSTEVERDADAVVVAGMGRGDEQALEAALATRAGYVGLVASARRAASVLAELRARGLGEGALARVHSPAGLDLGSSRQEEIAVAILAQLIAWRHTDAAPIAPPPERHPAAVPVPPPPERHPDAAPTAPPGERHSRHEA